MSTTVRFREHDEFHRAALHTAIFGAVAGLLTYLVARVIPAAGGLTAPWAIGLLVAGAGFGLLPAARRTRVAELGILVLIGGAVGLVATLAAARGRDSLGHAAIALGFGLLVARGVEGRRGLIVLACGAGTVLVARYVLASFAYSATLAHLPGWTVAPLAGAAFSFVAAMAILARHIDLGQDRVADAYAACKGTVGGEVGELVEQGMGVWKKAEETVDEESPVRRAVEDSVLRLFDVAKKWQTVESAQSRSSAEGLQKRVEAMQEKIEKTEDAVARQQYEQARAALVEQLRYLKEIGTARERVVARMHNYLAVMERLRLAFVNHRSADASRLSTEVQPILDDLTTLGKEIDCASEALVEVESESAKA
jgi:hypothetical protein